jgi:predicted HD phosphohydrolase
MNTVSYVHMEDGTRADYELQVELEREHARGLPDRLLALLRDQADRFLGNKVSQLQHSLQTATRALRDGADEELVVGALLHDVGDGLAPYNHAELAAAILRPYVGAGTYWIIRHHAIFQAYYYNHHLGRDRYERERYRDQPFFQATLDFSEKWDQTSFDPDFPTLGLVTFEPPLRRVFTREPFECDRAP